MSSEQKHTPGPWRTEGGKVYGSGLEVATLYPACVQEEVPMVEANGCLIASAPDLLAALKLVDFSFDHVREHESYEAALTRFCTAKRAARVAIAKAEGQHASSPGLEPRCTICGQTEALHDAHECMVAQNDAANATFTGA